VVKDRLMIYESKVIFRSGLRAAIYNLEF